VDCTSRVTVLKETLDGPFQRPFKQRKSRRAAVRVTNPTILHALVSMYPDKLHPVPHLPK
jgi:hypothetical protein